MNQIKRISVELQSLGVRLPIYYKGRKGGAGPSEGCIIILKDHYISVPTTAWYVKDSPYKVIKDTDHYLLKKFEEDVERIDFPNRPLYYDQKDPDGIALYKIGLLHGRDCFASTVFQRCIYWGTNLQCRFCGIELSLLQRNTIEQKTPSQLAFAASKAKLLDGVSHVTLTTGAKQDEKETVRYLCRCTEAIKEETLLPIHVQIMPLRDLNLLKELKIAGTDTIGIHIESFDKEILHWVSPAKSVFGIDNFFRVWDRAVDIFGFNQVSSFLIIGLGEDKKKMLEGIENLCKIGVFPYVVPLRPIPGTRLEKSLPPSPNEMYRFYEEVSSILRFYGLSSSYSKAGCVRCGSCSSLNMFEIN